jgi:hypothetical protein
MQAWWRAYILRSRAFGERRPTIWLLVGVAAWLIGAYVANVVTDIGTAHPFELSRAFWFVCWPGAVGITIGTIVGRQRKRKASHREAARSAAR